MSEQRSDGAAEGVAPWFEHNGLWSPSEDSSLAATPSPRENTTASATATAIREESAVVSGNTARGKSLMASTASRSPTTSSSPSPSYDGERGEDEEDEEAGTGVPVLKQAQEREAQTLAIKSAEEDEVDRSPREQCQLSPPPLTSLGGISAPASQLSAPLAFTAELATASSTSLTVHHRAERFTAADKEPKRLLPKPDNKFITSQRDTSEESDEVMTGGDASRAEATADSSIVPAAAASLSSSHRSSSGRDSTSSEGPRDLVDTRKRHHSPVTEKATDGTSDPTASAALNAAPVWTSCQHSDPPARYRDTPAYYCTYCSYTVCETCHALIAFPDTAAASMTTTSNGRKDEDTAAQEKECRKEGGASTPSHAIGQSSHQNQHQHAERELSSTAWLDDVLRVPSTAVRAGRMPNVTSSPTETPVAAAAERTNTSSPQRPNQEKEQLCHLCRRGHLVREEALLYEWCCEGPAPERRRHRGHTLVYDTQNLQKYHFMRAQRETRITSTAALHAQLLSASPALLSVEESTRHDENDGGSTNEGRCRLERIDNGDGGVDGRVHSRSLALRQTRVETLKPPRRDPFPVTSSHTSSSRSARLPPHATPPQRSTRRTASAAVTGTPSRDGVHVDRVDQRSRPHTSRRRDAVVTPCACEEGGSFTFAVRNPRLEVQLVWCAVNRELREEAPGYRCTGGTSLNNSGLGSRSGDGSATSANAVAAASVTPLLLWRCPPSLPGLPARPYRVHIPYGLYAFANVHALTLYVASDIFKKAATQLTDAKFSSSTGRHNYGAPSHAWGAGVAGRLEDGGGIGSYLTAVKVAPASTLRPLLTVTVLHHVATTPRPLRLPRPSFISTEDKDGQREEKPENRAQAPNEREVFWPDGLHSPELTLCVDHLLHGRSLAVYGIASKFFFLHHVASSAELSSSFQMVTVDASAGRSHSGGQASGTQTSNISSSVEYGGGVGGASGHRRGSSSSSSSVLRQLLAVGHLLAKRTEAPAVLTSETRAHLGSAAAAKKRAEDEEDAQGRRRVAEHALRYAPGPEPNGADRQKWRVAPVGNADQVPDDAAVDAHLQKKKHAKRTRDLHDGEIDCEIGEDVAAVARAALDGDVARSPALARDSTAAVLSASAARSPHRKISRGIKNSGGSGVSFTVDIVDVDTPSADTSNPLHATPPSASHTPNEQRGEDKERATSACVTPAKGIVREVLLTSTLTPPHASVLTSPYTHTPLKWVASTPQSQSQQQQQQMSQRGNNSGGSSLSTPPLSSPIPAFFEALQRTIDGDAVGLRDNTPNESQRIAPMEPKETSDAYAGHREVRVVCEELPQYFGGVNTLTTPTSTLISETTTAAAAASGVGAGSLITWKAPRILYENNNVRQEVLRAVRRHHARRRCVQWASLPSTCAVSQIQEQNQLSLSRMKSNSTQGQPSTLLLTSAHATRPGWRAPVLLILHNVDLLDGEEVNVLAQLCSRFAFPNPHLQLLVSFDHPHWPLSPLGAVVERIGGCAVQLRSLLLPRVHELQHVNSIHLLTEFEAAAAASGSGGGGRGRRGANATAGSNNGNTGADVAAAAVASTSGSSHLLHDTMRRVLFSLPPAFNSLLRILLDVQDEAGDGVFVSLFTVTARFEKSGVMISQGRLKALLRELTSNRIAKYDPAEHALMVPQVPRLRKVLEEVMSQRDSSSAAGAPV